MVKDMLKDMDRTKQVQGELSKVTGELNRVMASPDMNVAAMSEVLNQFGTVFTDMGVVGDAMTGAMSKVTESGIPASEVDEELDKLQQIAASDGSSAANPASVTSEQGQQVSGMSGPIVAGGPNGGPSAPQNGGGPAAPTGGSAGGGVGDLQARLNQMKW